MGALSSVLTVCDTVIICGVNYENLWNNMTPAESIAEDIYFNYIRSFMDK